jgi:hypothetical protein
MVPAGADNTNTQFTIQGGSLAISVPGSADLGTVNAGELVLSGSLGSVTVNDTRGSLVAAWSASVSSTDFTTGGGSASEKVTKTNLAYSAGLPTASSGTGAFTPGVVASLAVPGVAGAWAGSGNNSVTWNPTITVTLLPGQVAGVYTGTVTHSVA